MGAIRNYLLKRFISYFHRIYSKYSVMKEEEEKVGSKFNENFFKKQFMKI